MVMEGYRYFIRLFYNPRILLVMLAKSLVLTDKNTSGVFRVDRRLCLESSIFQCNPDGEQNADQCSWNQCPKRAGQMGV